ncbi:DinB family protein [Agrococcus versicolor]|uniref:DinB family protein n=1 Tax=Agrococcus versicolor TaxID=501482 RepID=A0ABP5MJY0_9MICO
MSDATEAPAASPDASPWEPPLAGSEVEHVLASLDRLRTTFRWKADDLTLEALHARTGASALSFASLLKHLACVEDEKTGMALSGASYGPPWAGMAGYEGSPQEYAFDPGALSAAELYALWDDAVRRSHDRLATALADGGLDQRVAMGADDGLVVSLRRLLHDLIEEYGRHTGHADLLREAIDGRVGEDPPEGWHATSGSSPVGCRTPASMDPARTPTS